MDSAIAAGQYENVTSVLVAQNGRVIHEAYYHGADRQTKHNTRSATKTMATFLVGLAIDRGHIESVDQPILDFLGHHRPLTNPDPRKEEITIEDLLTMSASLECDDGNPYSRGNEERMYPIEDWTGFFLDLPIRSYPFGPPPAERPYGRAFSYCTAGATTLAEVVEVAMGYPAARLLTEGLLTPLGIVDYTFDYTPAGILRTAGGSGYRSRDFLRLIQLCLNDGAWKGKRLLPLEWIEAATTPRARAREGVDYGYLLWLKSFGSDRKYPAYYMSGNGGQKVLAIPSLDLAVVITTTNYNNRNAHGYTDELLTAYIIPAVSN